MYCCFCCSVDFRVNFTQYCVIIRLVVATIYVKEEQTHCF